MVQGPRGRKGVRTPPQVNLPNIELCVQIVMGGREPLKPDAHLIGKLMNLGRAARGSLSSFPTSSVLHYPFDRKISVMYPTC